MAHLTDAPGNSGGAFVEKDVVNGVAGTVVSAKWSNMVQEEIANAVTSQGLALDDGDNSQLAKALEMVAGRGPWANLLLNPWFNVQQRLAPGFGSASFLLGPAATETFFIDRWFADLDSTVQALIFTSLGPPDGFIDGSTIMNGIATLGHSEYQNNAANDQFYASAPQFIRVDGRAGTTAAGSVRIRQIVPYDVAGRGGQVSATFAAKTITAATTLDCVLRIRTYEGAAFANALGAVVETVSSATLTIDDTWGVFAVAGTLSLDTDVEYVEIEIDLLNVDNTTPSVDITGAQLIFGGLPASGFPLVRPFDLEMLMCQRYFEAINSGASDPDNARAALARGMISGGTIELNYPYRTRKRMNNVAVTMWNPSNTVDRIDMTDGNAGGVGTAMTVTSIDANAHEIRSLTFTGTLPGSSDLLIGEFQATADAEIIP